MENRAVDSTGQLLNNDDLDRIYNATYKQQSDEETESGTPMSSQSAPILGVQPTTPDPNILPPIPTTTTTTIPLTTQGTGTVTTPILVDSSPPSVPSSSMTTPAVTASGANQTQPAGGHVIVTDSAENVGAALGSGTGPHAQQTLFAEPVLETPVAEQGMDVPTHEQTLQPIAEEEDEDVVEPSSSESAVSAAVIPSLAVDQTTANLEQDIDHTGFEAVDENDDEEVTQNAQGQGFSDIPDNDENDDENIGHDLADELLTTTDDTDTENVMSTTMGQRIIPGVLLAAANRNIAPLNINQAGMNANLLSMINTFNAAEAMRKRKREEAQGTQAGTNAAASGGVVLQNAQLQGQLEYNQSGGIPSAGTGGGGVTAEKLDQFDRDSLAKSASDMDNALDKLAEPFIEGSKNVMAATGTKKEDFHALTTHIPGSLGFVPKYLGAGPEGRLKGDMYWNEADYLDIRAQNPMDQNDSPLLRLAKGVQEVQRHAMSYGTSKRRRVSFGSTGYSRIRNF